jgi:hypothetical protein
MGKRQLTGEFGGDASGAEDAPAEGSGGLHAAKDSTIRLRGTFPCRMFPLAINSP